MLKKISHKLMATILGVTLIAAAAIYASGYFAVRSGLGGITEQLHRLHLDNIANRVGSLYEIHRGWDALLADDRWLRSLFPGQPREAYRLAAPRRDAGGGGHRPSPMSACWTPMNGY